ncbi:uncharacterized protein [Euphorbia lathyris]|uniref:uncharacterized protein isoform X2 n=1 Tax=Euphorbia lathyris TaxID=212925 RepID=UPI0033131710
MSTGTRKRPKPDSKYKPQHNTNLSSSSHSSIMEPPYHLFPSKEDFLRLLTVLAIASSVAFTCNFIATYLNPTAKPFCDTDTHSSDSFSDICEPCPRNGGCTQGNLECDHGYRRHNNMCIEDGDISERAKKLSEFVENRLCEAYAQFLCYGSGIIWVQEDIIWNDLSGHKLIEDFAPDIAIYAYTKKRAMEIMEKLLEMRVNSNGEKELKCPDLIAEQYKPFTCRLSQWISKNALFVAPFCALVLGSVLLLRKLQRRWYLSTRADALYEQVCEILEENALTSKQSNGEREPWVVASQLRDHLLSSKERKDPILWKRVEELIQEDSRVDRYPKLVKGDSKVVWEWEGSWSSARRRKMGEASKLKSRIDVKENSGRRIHAMKSEAVM